MPVGGLGTVEGEDLRLQGAVAAVDGSAVLRDEERGPLSSPESVGERLGGRMLQGGAADLMARKARGAGE